MGFDLEKHKALHDELHAKAIKEIYEDLPDSFLQFTNSQIIDYCLHRIKVGTKSELSSRVLNNWVGSGVILVNDEDKGKNRRFDKLESIWLGIVIEARKFGLSIEMLRKVRSELMDSPVPNFSLFKLSVLNIIFGSSDALLISDEGYTTIVPLKLYTRKIERAGYAPHLFFKFLDFITAEYPNNAFDVDFKIADVYDSVEKMTMMYFLKTGDYKSIQLYLKEGDVRLIENSKELTKNKELMEVISSWNFVKVKIVLADKTEATITL